MKLTLQQEQVLSQIRKFVQSDASVFILRGYAGTGKTTMIRHMLQEVLPSDYEVALMAPTGRAARVLQMKTGCEANTIHRAIYRYKRIFSDESEERKEDRVEIYYGVSKHDKKILAIVDEASMVPTRTHEHELFKFGTGNLMRDLLTFVGPVSGSKLIFIGDPAQLPPVGEQKAQALEREYFQEQGLKVMEAELTEVLRQGSGSLILQNAMQIRGLLAQEKRNRLVFEEQDGEVESLAHKDFVARCIQANKEGRGKETAVICFSNAWAKRYNDSIREALYGQEYPPLQEGDRLLVVQNNYLIGWMNGDLVEVISIGRTERISAPVYVNREGKRIRETIHLEFVAIELLDSDGNLNHSLLSLDLLNSERAMLTIDEQKALYINFKMRHPHLRPNTLGHDETLRKDPYYNCLRAKYGYALTGHKCQGGEWTEVYVDYNGRTGLSDDCLRWAYTATTRATKTLLMTNYPRITPFSKFKITPIEKCKDVSPEHRTLAKIGYSPYHAPEAPAHLRAKWLCIQENLSGSPYRVCSIDSKPYLEIYYIETPEGTERYDIHYKGSGVFRSAVAKNPSKYSPEICQLLDNEDRMPIEFSYLPQEPIYEQLYSLIRSACDELDIPLTNVVEHREDYSVVFYFRTSGSISYLKIYVNGSDFVTTAMPKSLLGTEDEDLSRLIELIQAKFE